MSGRVLLTGFEAFAGNCTNPTEELVRKFSDGPHFKTLILPVSFEHAWNKLHQQIIGFRPDWIISCGVAAKRETIDLERVALNLMDASIVDNDGKLMKEMRISPHGPDCFLSDLPLSEWKENLAAHYPVKVSLTAGSYVCNYLYYQLMLHRTHYHYESLFIHFPYPSASLSEESFFDFMQAFLQKID